MKLRKVHTEEKVEGECTLETIVSDKSPELNMINNGFT